MVFLNSKVCTIARSTSQSLYFVSHLCLLFCIGYRDLNLCGLVVLAVVIQYGLRCVS